MGLLAAYAVPHPPLIVPAVGQGRERAIQQTIDAYEFVAREIVLARPEILIVVSPHAPLLRDAFHLDACGILAGSMHSFGADDEAVEPMNVAFFRSSMGPQVRDGAYFVVGVEPDVTHIVLGYKDNGILFRSTLIDQTNSERRNSEADLMPILNDVRNTAIFAGNQYRGIEIRDLILGGSVGENPKLKSLLEAAVSVNVSLSQRDRKSVV